MVDPATIRIGSAFIAAIAGCSRWKTPMDAWNALMGYEPPRETDETDLGNMLEEPIARIACKKLGIGGYSKAETLNHPTELWAKATPDWWIEPGYRRILKTKNVGVSPPLNDWHKDGVVALPEYVFVQVQWQLGMWASQGLDVFSPEANVAALLGGRGPEIMLVHFDAALFSELMAVADNFRRKYLLRHTPPSGPDGSDAFSRYLRARFPRASGEFIQASPADEATLLALQTAEKERKKWTGIEEQMKQSLQVRIGEATGMLAGAGRVTWAERAAYQVKAHEVKASRRLTVKWLEVDDAAAA